MANAESKPIVTKVKVISDEGNPAQDVGAMADATAAILEEKNQIDRAALILQQTERLKPAFPDRRNSPSIVYLQALRAGVGRARARIIEAQLVEEVFGLPHPHLEKLRGQMTAESALRQRAEQRAALSLTKRIGVTVLENTGRTLKIVFMGGLLTTTRPPKKGNLSGNGKYINGKKFPI